MILTVTPNPSIDLLYEADHLVWDDANRVEMPRRRAGGQGVNLTRAARTLGGDSVAIALVGGRAGAELTSLLDADRTSYIAVPIPAETRVFVAVRESSSGRSLLVNPRGPVLTEDDRTHLLEETEAACAKLEPEWVVCSGSVPRGLGNDLYASVSRLAHTHSAQFVADCDGEALECATKSGCDLLAPNQHEAARMLGSSVVTVQDAAKAARSLLDAAPRVLIKLGENGAVMATRDGCWHARGREVRRGSAVGAGDAFLAAFLIADGDGALSPEALCRAVAAGSAVLMSAGTTLLSRRDYEAMLAEVVVTPI
jgi:1-phosphofructokinase